jgi:hypothetical protein
MMAWTHSVIRAMDNLSAPPHERVTDGAIRARELGQRIRHVAMNVYLFSLMVKQLNVRIEHREDVDATWCDLMTPVGPVRVFSAVTLPEGHISLDVDERLTLFSAERNALTMQQLERRIEIETEDAERMMNEVEQSRLALAKQRGA